MPEKGWAIVSVRVDTARMVKELAHRRGMTVDEYINTLIKSHRNRSHRTEYM
jgi:hypothetical protein